MRSHSVRPSVVPSHLGTPPARDMCRLAHTRYCVPGGTVGSVYGLPGSVLWDVDFVRGACGVPFLL